jgi:hypothetical protein
MAKKVRRTNRPGRESARAVRRQEFARVERDLEIQFRRIAQIQAELDEIKRAIARHPKD